MVPYVVSGSFIYKGDYRYDSTSLANISFQGTVHVWFEIFCRPKLKIIVFRSAIFCRPEISRVPRAVARISHVLTFSLSFCTTNETSVKGVSSVFVVGCFLLRLLAKH